MKEEAMNLRAGTVIDLYKSLSLAISINVGVEHFVHGSSWKINQINLISIINHIHRAAVHTSAQKL